jgi:hypothetical protein
MNPLRRAWHAAWRANWFHRVRNEIVRYLHLDKLERRVTDVSTELSAQLTRTTDLANETARRVDEVVQLQTQHADALDRVDRLESLLTVSAWIAQYDQRESLLVSVVTPTHNRSDRLPEAMASVQLQSYGRWEHIVVDDGSTDDTATVLERCDDPRVRVLRVDNSGPAAARNAALDVAVGDVVVYLDDDNRFHRDWLKAVVWTFETHSNVNVVCGARLIDDYDFAFHRKAGGLPRVQFERFDRTKLEQFNTADMGMLAHRKLDLRFDERLWYLADWDLYLQLTEEGPAFTLPAIALVYTTDAENRLAEYPELEQEMAIVRQNLRSRQSECSRTSV